MRPHPKRITRAGQQPADNVQRASIKDLQHRFRTKQNATKGSPSKKSLAIFLGASPRLNVNPTNSSGKQGMSQN